MARIEIVEGYNQGKVLEFQGSVTLGRAPNNALCLHDSRASRQHALIRTAPDGNGFIISDLGSGNGTYVGSTKLQPGIPHQLQDGDLITIASTRLSFHEDRFKASNAGKDQEKANKHTSSSIFINNKPVPVVVEPTESAVPAVTHVYNAGKNMLEAQEQETSAVTIKRLRAMAELAISLGEVPGQEAALDRVMNKIFEVFPQADRGFIMLRDKNSDEMIPIIGRERDVSPDQQKVFPISRTIVNKVVEQKQSILSTNAQDDFGAQRSISDFSICAMMCAPMICKDELLGVINIDTTNPGKTFDKDDLALFTGIASLTATALKNAALFDQLEAQIQARSQLSRYVPADVAKGIVDGEIQAELGMKRSRGTVLVCDMQGFSSICDDSDPALLMRLLNDYFRIATDIIARNQGILDRFGGDTIKAFWNVMLPDDRPELNALITALQIQASSWYFNLGMKRESRLSISMEIGINTGELASGNIGQERVEFAVIGKTVDLAAGISAVATPWQILATAATFEAVRTSCTAISLPPLKVNGLEDPIQLFSVRGLATDTNRMILNIPVRLVDTKDNILGDGLITGSVEEDGKRRVFFATDAVVIADQEVNLDLDLPEYDQPLRLTGTIADHTKETYYGQTTFSKSTLKNLKGDETVFSFLHPGSMVKSSRTWEDMGRR